MRMLRTVRECANFLSMPDVDGRTALQTAIANDDSDMVEIFLNKLADNFPLLLAYAMSSLPLMLIKEIDTPEMLAKVTDIVKKLRDVTDAEVRIVPRAPEPDQYPGCDAL